jgi:hypothetical protein
LHSIGRGNTVFNKTIQQRTHGHCPTPLRNVVREGAVVDSGIAVYLQTTALFTGKIAYEPAATYGEMGPHRKARDGDCAGGIKAATAVTRNWYDRYGRNGTVASIPNEPATDDGDDVLRPKTTATAREWEIAVKYDIDHGEKAKASNATTAEPWSKSALYREPIKRESSSPCDSKYAKFRCPRSTQDCASIANDADPATNNRQPCGPISRIVDPSQYLQPVGRQHDGVWAMALSTKAIHRSIGVGRRDSTRKRTVASNDNRLRKRWCLPDQ